MYLTSDCDWIITNSCPRYRYCSGAKVFKCGWTHWSCTWNGCGEWVDNCRRIHVLCQVVLSVFRSICIHSPGSSDNVYQCGSKNAWQDSWTKSVKYYPSLQITNTHWRAFLVRSRHISVQFYVWGNQSPQGWHCKKFAVSLHIQAKHQRHIEWFHKHKIEPNYV